jgi:hypothetical protein
MVVNTAKLLQPDPPGATSLVISSTLMHLLGSAVTMCIISPPSTILHLPQHASRRTV